LNDNNLGLPYIRHQYSVTANIVRAASIGNLFALNALTMYFRNQFYTWNATSYNVADTFIDIRHIETTLSFTILPLF